MSSKFECEVHIKGILLRSNDKYVNAICSQTFACFSGLYGSNYALMLNFACLPLGSGTNAILWQFYTINEISFNKHSGLDLHYIYCVADLYVSQRLKMLALHCLLLTLSLCSTNAYFPSGDIYGYPLALLVIASFECTTRSLATSTTIIVSFLSPRHCTKAYFFTEE